MTNNVKWQARKFIPLQNKRMGYEFSYDGGASLLVRFDDGGQCDVMSIPEWVMLQEINQEAFTMLCIMWLIRNGLIRA